MADVVPHSSGVQDAIDHWIRVVHEQRAEIAALKEAAYWDGRIVQEAEHITDKCEPGCVDVCASFERLRIAVAAKRDHLTAEAERKAGGK